MPEPSAGMYCSPPNSPSAPSPMSSRLTLPELAMFVGWSPSGPPMEDGAAAVGMGAGGVGTCIPCGPNSIVPKGPNGVPYGDGACTIGGAEACTIIGGAGACTIIGAGACTIIGAGACTTIGACGG